MSEAPETPRFFRARSWDKYQDRHVRNPSWIKLDLGFFDDPAVWKLSDCQRIAFVAVLILCGKRMNRVPFDADYIKKRCGLRVTPDLPLFMAQGLIEPICCTAEADTPLDERRGEEKRGKEKQTTEPAAPAAPSIGTQAQRDLVDRCSSVLGQTYSYRKANLDAVTRAAKHYSPDDLVAVLGAVRDGTTDLARWCRERLGGPRPLKLAYLLRPGEKGAADTILDELQAAGPKPAPSSPPPPTKPASWRDPTLWGKRGA